MAADLQRDVTRAPICITRLSNEDEVRIGDESVHRYGYAEPYKDENMAAIENYTGRVGSRVTRHAQRKIAFHFHLFPDFNLINAFALPGGHVFMGLGLLKQMRTEDELAFVLGHEIEHIDHYQAVERVQIEAQLNKLNLGEFAAVAQLPLSLWQAGYSKDEEFEADREGLRIAVALGYSPQGAVDMLQRFLQLDREYVIHAETSTGELSQIAIDGLMGYFRSHPLPSERLAQANDVILNDQLPVHQPLARLTIKPDL